MAGVGENLSVGCGACGLYLHVPFCRAKCGYCDFYSEEVGRFDTAVFVSSVIAELRQRLAACPHQVRTVYCGGGTPTILPRDRLTTLLDVVTELVGPPTPVEFTVEANPATVDENLADLLVASGVTRVSMGAQSFVAEELATLERLHTSSDIRPSVELLRRHGVSQVNLDLIFGIPGQSLDSWAESLRRAIELEPDHVACYGLTYESGTRLTKRRERGQIRPCDEELEAEMYVLAEEVLAKAGFEQYEISNFARPGCESQHNLIYWRNEPYIGVGPSAAGCVDGRRYKNVADVNGYARLIAERGHAEAESEMIDPKTLMAEMIMMQLRLVEGLSIACFQERTGCEPVGLFGEALPRLVSLGLLKVSETHIAPTRRGRLVSNAVMAELVVACDQHRGPGSR